MNYSCYTCPTCGVLLQLGVDTAHICEPDMIRGTLIIDKKTMTLTEEDVRRIVREELAKSNNRDHR